MSTFTSARQYLEELERRSALPQGFSVATTDLEFTSLERGQKLPMKLTLILADEPLSRFAGVFTSNRFAGAPILIARERIDQELMQGVLINNKVANVGAPGGLEDARSLCDGLGQLLGVEGRLLLPASTGVVGWKLPVAEMKSALPRLAEGLRRDSALEAARAIMTTDSYPKIHREEVGEGSILGLAKGAGMIEPNLATMLVFILTDLSVERGELRRILSSCVRDSFNLITIDGDQSTSDMVLLFASARRPPVEPEAFHRALLALCRRLAEDIVRNGEGVGHVIRVRVEQAQTRQTAAAAGKAVVNSPLVKTAIFGNDPNVGRIVAALGDYFGTAQKAAFDLKRLQVYLGGFRIFGDGCFRLDRDKERQLTSYLSECALDPEQKGYPAHQSCVEIRIVLGTGREEAGVLGADLSYEYVKENADYRS